MPVDIEFTLLVHSTISGSNEILEGLDALLTYDCGEFTVPRETIELLRTHLKLNVALTKGMFEENESCKELIDKMLTEEAPKKKRWWSRRNRLIFTLIVHDTVSQTKELSAALTELLCLPKDRYVMTEEVVVQIKILLDKNTALVTKLIEEQNQVMELVEKGVEKIRKQKEAG